MTRFGLYIRQLTGGHIGGRVGEGWGTSEDRMGPACEEMGELAGLAEALLGVDTHRTAPLL